MEGETRREVKKNRGWKICSSMRRREGRWAHKPHGVSASISACSAVIYLQVFFSSWCLVFSGCSASPSQKRMARISKVTNIFMIVYLLRYPSLLPRQHVCHLFRFCSKWRLLKSDLVGFVLTIIFFLEKDGNIFLSGYIHMCLVFLPIHLVWMDAK